ncbi:MAG: hypothetical protein J6568_05165 [Snodgrassella sp.]|jgi:hypothetical protein|nr:hypothetical protein [Snodgrassella sp.]
MGKIGQYSKARNFKAEATSRLSNWINNLVSLFSAMIQGTGIEMIFVDMNSRHVQSI